MLLQLPPVHGGGHLGGAIHHEERVARGEESARGPADYKATLQGPLAALGDGFFWTALRPCLGAAAALGTLVVGWPAVVAALVLYNALAMGLRARLFLAGYRGGDAVVEEVLVCPSMNTQMYVSQAVQENLRILQTRGCAILEPGSGELACRTEGPGRLPEPEEIVEEARMLLSAQDLSGLRVLVTAGATLEPLDPVRYMSNRSSGKMGYALARAARRRGAKVTLVSGPTALKPPRDVTLCRVKTAEEMRQAVLADCRQHDVVVKAAAVLDWRPKETAEHKIKKGRGVQTLELVENPDILAELGCSRGDRPCTLVGFAAETQDWISNAQEKLKKKNLDLIVVNDVSREDAGFEADTNAVRCCLLI